MPSYPLRKTRSPDQTKGGYFLVETKEELKRVVSKLYEIQNRCLGQSDRYSVGKLVGIDFETTGVNPEEESPVHKGKIVTVQLSWISEKLGLGMRGQNLGCRVGLQSWCLEDKDFVGWLENDVEQKLSHNASFELHLSANHGIKLRGIKACTLRMAWQAWSTKAVHHDLKSLMYKHLRYDDLGSWPQLFNVPVLSDKTGKELKRRRTLGADEVLARPDLRDKFWDYATLDAKAGLEIYPHLCEVLENMPSTPLGTQLDLSDKFWQPFCLLLAHIERTGVLLDEDYCEKQLIKAEEDIERCIVDLNSWAFEQWHDFPIEDFNWRSPDQLKRLLYGEAKYGQDLDKPGWAKSSKNGVAIPTLNLEPSPVWKKGSSWNWKEKKYDLKTDADAIQYLGDHAEAELKQALRTLLEFRKSCSGAKYFKKLPGFVRETSGRIHTVLRPDAETTRINASYPELLQIPTNPQKDRYRTRKAFPAPDGHSIIPIDQSQLEMRILAHYLIEWFGDYTLAKDIDKADIHSLNAHRLYSKQYPKLFEGVPEGTSLKGHPKLARFRDDIKGTAYGLNYGMGEYQLAVRLRDEHGEPAGLEYAQMTIEGYLNIYPGQREFMKRVWEEVTQKGYVVDILGYVRPLPDGRCNVRWEDAQLDKDRKNKKVGFKVWRAWRQALNNYMQASAAKVMQEVMLRCNTIPDLYLMKRGWFNQPLYDMKVEQVLQVHDEDIFYVPDNYAQQAVDVIIPIMENPMLCKLKCPLKASYKITKDWGEGH